MQEPFATAGFRLLGNTDDAASRSSASVPSNLALLMVSPAQVVSAGVDDKRSLFRWRQQLLYIHTTRMVHTPNTLSCPINLIYSSVMEPLELPWASVSKLPRSPTWRSESDGAPCCLENGLTAKMQSQ